MRRFGTWLVARSSLLVLLSGLALFAAAQEPWHWPEHAENLKVLPQDTDAQQLRETMIGFSRSLGVHCAFCHVGEDGKPLSTYDFRSDDKANKDRAREMMRMVGSIRDRLATVDFGEGTRVSVGCETCHRGRPRPTTMLEELRAAYAEGGAAQAISHYDELRDRYAERGTLDFGARPLNNFGYELLQAGDVDGAIAVLRKNASLFPASANSWDSLGEAYLAAGRTEQAAIYYRKSLELDPDNENALQQLHKIEAGGD